MRYRVTIEFDTDATRDAIDDVLVAMQVQLETLQDEHNARVSDVVAVAETVAPERNRR